MSTIVISGCGGGYDIYGGLIVYHRMKANTTKIIMLNYSFTSTNLLNSTSCKITNHLYRIDPNIQIPENASYYPEAYLSIELNQSVYALADDPTINDIIDAYTYITNTYKPDKLYLVDGGCDVLLTGIEEGLGTPVEDMMHLRAVMNIDIHYKYILAIGVNVDTGHGVLQNDIDKRFQHLEETGIQLSKEYLTLSDESVKFYYNIVKRCNPINTIVHSLILSGLEGYRGLHTPQYLEKRVKNVVPITDQTCTLFQFDLVSVAQEVKYLNLLNVNATTDEIDNIIDWFQFENTLKSL